MSTLILAHGVTPELIDILVNDQKAWDEFRKRLTIYVEITNEKGQYDHTMTVLDTLGANFAFSSIYTAMQIGISLPHGVFGAAHCLAYFIHNDIPAEHKEGAVKMIKEIVERYADFGSDECPKTAAGAADLAKQRGTLQ